MSTSSWSASSPVHDMHMDIESESVSSLEREFCSNFACCGEVHADLHALIAHHEAAPAHAHPHVRLRLRLAAAPPRPTAPVAQPLPHNDGPTTTPPSPSSSSSSSSFSSSSSSSSTCSSQPDSPITPFDSPLHPSTAPDPKDTAQVLPDDLLPDLEYPTYEHCYSAAIASDSTHTSALFSRPDAPDPDANPFVPTLALVPATTAHLQLQPEPTHPLSPLPGPPAAFVLSSCFARAPSVASGCSSSAESPSPSPSPSPMPLPTQGPAVRPRAGTKRKAEGEHGVYGGAGVSMGAGRGVSHGVGAGPYAGSVLGHGVGAGVGGGVKRRERGRAKERGGAGGRARVRGREKLFACPTPGCTKSYLNPNGLKYHLDKGTCVLEADAPRAATTPEAVDVYPVVKEPMGECPGPSPGPGPGADAHTNATTSGPASALSDLGMQYPSSPPIPTPMVPTTEPTQAQTTRVPADQPVRMVYQPQPVLARQRAAPLLQVQGGQGVKQRRALQQQQQMDRARPRLRGQPPQPQTQAVYRAVYMPQAQAQSQVQTQMQRGYR